MSNISRRNVILSAATGAAAVAMRNSFSSAADSAAAAPAAKNGRINHSVCKWCFGKVPLDELAAYCASLGMKGIDLLGPDDFATMKKHGLICTMTTSHGIEKGLNRKENHEECLGKIRTSLEKTAEAGFPNVICFSGNRAGMDDEEGLQNCAIALKQIMPLAEEKKVTVCMELLNSKQHKDYMCDHTAWGAKLVQAVGSERFKLLYDIYHMQVMEGDIIATIRANKDYIGHYHTAGVPGRHEIDDTQELNYPPIMQAIVDTGFKGYVAQEFIPAKKDKLASLAQAVQICDV
jgi:hydroxypyruvate isomerase